jgi:putative ABC transport system permease protein
MLKNYFKIAFRNLMRFKVYTLINLFGLSIGLSVAVLILLFVTDELGFDKFHQKGDRIYKIVTSNGGDGGMETNAWPVADKLVNEYPEVEAVVYTRKAPASLKVNYEGKRYAHNTYYAGSDFFNIFTFPLLEGNPQTALKDPYTLVITEKVKQQYFGSALALGKTLLLQDTLEFTITGVVADVPTQSHIQFDMLASFTTHEQLSGWFSYSEGWGNFDVRNYMLLKEGTSIAAVEEKAHNMYMETVGDWLEEMGMEFYVEFVPQHDIYLRSKFHNGFGPNGSIDQVYLVSAIAIFIVLLACINFINITTARSVYRAKEVGLRKIVGSSRGALFWQFLSESFIITLMAFASVALVVDLLLPLFNQLMGKTYLFASLFTLPMLMGTTSLLAMVTLLSGLYPAKVISGFKPVEVLKGKLKSGSAGVRLRRVLVVFQFVVSAGLVLGTLIVLDQLDYMRNQDLGFDKEQLLVIDVTGIPKVNSPTAFKNLLKQNSAISEVSLTNALPGRPGWQGQWAYPEGFDEGKQVDTEYMAIDENYIDALGLELVAGRNFDLERTDELENGVIINETSVKEMGWETAENAIGKTITSPSKHPEGTVIGVVKDYHGLGLQDDIWAKVMDYSSAQFGRYYAIRFETGNASELIATTKGNWDAQFKDYEFDYFFLDQDFDRQYRSEERLMNVFIIFAIITVLIAGIGLLGLVSFMIVSRTKEIGIRKVLGADILSINKMLSKEFIMLVVLGNLIAMPLMWYFASDWLMNFAYHTELNPLLFLSTLLITVTASVLIISFQTTNAARQNPVDAIRTE